MQGHRAPQRRSDDPKRRFIADKITNECYDKLIKVKGKQYKEITYQTHIDVIEYASYPSVPPPANTKNVGLVKKRVLVLAIQYPGIAILQKGKLHEEKKIYQIGRTWDLNELKVIKRAGTEGMIFQLNKTYYWKSDEGEDRLWRFCRYVTQAVGNYTHKYPVLEGFTLEELRLPASPPGGSSVGASSQSSIQSFHSASQLPYSQLQSQSQQQQQQLSQQQQQQGRNASDLYKNIDFTVNGQLPTKPMRVLQSDRSHITNESQIEKIPSRESPGYPLHKTSLYSSGVAEPDNHSFVFGSKENHTTPHSKPSPYKSNYTESNKSIDEKRSANSIGESINEAGKRLQEQIDHQSIVSSEKSIAHEQLKAFTQAIPEPPKSPDFGIEEITDESDSDKEQPISIRKRSLKREITKEELVNEPKTDSPLQELTDIVESHISLAKEEVIEPPTFNIETPEDSPPTTTSGLNIIKKSGEIFDISRIDHDPEVDEMYDDIGWSFKDSAISVIKQISMELTNVKQLTVKELTKIDLGDNSTNSNNDVTRSLEEVEHLNQIFQKTEIDFKMLAPEVEKIDENSHGLQVKFINKKLLYNDLKSILDKVSVDPNDLDDIAQFIHFERLNMLEPLEAKLLAFYNAVATIRSDNPKDGDDDDLSSMTALRQYQSRYNSVNSRFIDNFSQFIKKEFKQLIDGFTNLERFNGSILYEGLNKLLIYSAITFFIKKVEIMKLQELIQFFNSLFTGFFDNLIHAKLSYMISTQSNNSYDPGVSVRESLSSGFDEDLPLKKSRTLRLSRKVGKFGSLHSDITQKKIESIRKMAPSPPVIKQSNFIDDPKLVNSLIEESQALITFMQYFIGTFFHFEGQQSLEFGDYLKNNSIKQRTKLMTELPNIDEVNLIKNYSSNELISNMSHVFGNYLNIFMKKVNPSGLNIPIILLYVEHLISTIPSKNQDFVLVNFLNKAYDKYVNTWNKFVKSQIELLNNSIIVAKCGILQSVRNVNYFFLITESSIDNQDIRGSKVKDMIDNAYLEISESLMNLFMREDPLLKNHDLDDKEREYRNVSILQNIYFILEQFRDFKLTNSVNKELFDNLNNQFQKVEEVYFQKQLKKNIGKLVEFVNNYEALEKLDTSKYNKKYVKSMLTSYSIKDINLKAQEIHRKFEKHFISRTNMFEKDLVDKLWQDIEQVFNDYFTRLTVILKRDFDKEFDYNITKQDISQIFRSIR